MKLKEYILNGCGEIDDFEIVALDEEQHQNLFDGYLGEQKDVPNPLECGPNATYRNLREGIVYKKGPDNLWEVFVKDGQNGRNGQSAPGGGCGVDEVKKISTTIVSATVSNILSASTGLDGDTITKFGNQSGWSRRVLFSSFLGGGVTQTVETDILPLVSGSLLIDGNYTNGLNGLPPVIRAGYMLNKSRWLRSHLMVGIYYTSPAELTIREYWKNVKVRELIIPYSLYPSGPSGAIPMEIYSRYNYESLSATNAHAIRIHSSIVASTQMAPGFVTTNESWDLANDSYPVVNLNIDNPYRLTAQWSVPGQTLYVDSYELEG